MHEFFIACRLMRNSLKAKQAFGNIDSKNLELFVKSNPIIEDDDEGIELIPKFLSDSLLTL